MAQEMSAFIVETWWPRASACVDMPVITAVELRAEISALELERDQQQRALAERDAFIAQHLARIGDLQRQIDTLVEQLHLSARDQRALEARLTDLLAKRRALADTLAPGQLALLFGDEPLPTPPCATEASDVSVRRA